MKKIIFTIILASFLTACSSEAPIVSNNVIVAPKINPNLPPAIHTNKVDIKVLKADDLQKLSTVKDVVIYGLTPTEFNKLAGNLAEMQRYILQLKQTVIYYKEQNQ